MRIALDARTIYWPVRRGTGKNLIDLYRHLAPLRPDWRVVAYHRHPEPPPLLPQPFVQPKFIEMPGDRIDAWQRLRLPLTAWRDRADLLHCPANTCPTWMPLTTVVTIHDLIPLDLPRGRAASELHRFEQSVKTACHRAAWIICPSTYTRDRLVSEFGADPDRVTVNPWAADSSMRQLSQQQCEPVYRNYGVAEPYVLHFGAAGPRKNTRRVLEAWALLKCSARGNWKLLVVGLDDEFRKQMAQTAQHLGVTDSVVLHGFADEADLPALLSGADVLAYPSLSEGFGLPILDAWAAGTAVLTSNRTSLPEVAHDAAHITEPTDPAAIAVGIEKLISDPTYRSELIERGRKRLGQYSWPQTAERFARVLEQAADLTGIKRLAA